MSPTGKFARYQKSPATVFNFQAKELQTDKDRKRRERERETFPSSPLIPAGQI